MRKGVEMQIVKSAIYITRLSKIRIQFNITLFFSVMKHKFLNLVFPSSLIGILSVKNSEELASAPKKIAIVAVYPYDTEAYMLSLDKMFRSLTIAGYKLLIINNRKSKINFYESFASYKPIYIERKNIGRDFGAYKAGLDFLKKSPNFVKIENLILVNDTMYWTRIKPEIFDFLTETNWGALFLNKERHTHAQSFLLHFSSQILQDTAFNRFWRRYLSLNSRRSAIHSGEIKLSSVLLRANYVCEAYASQSFVLNELIDSAVSIDQLLTLPIGDIYPQIQVPVTPKYIDDSIKLTSFVFRDESKSALQLERNLIWYKIRNYLSGFIYSDSPHRIGLQLTFMFGLPLKKDIYKFIEINSLAEFLKIVAPEEVDSILKDIDAVTQKYMIGDRKGKSSRFLGEV
jgi:hypothetical protein